MNVKKNSPAKKERNDQGFLELSTLTGQVIFKSQKIEIQHATQIQFGYIIATDLNGTEVIISFPQAEENIIKTFRYPNDYFGIYRPWAFGTSQITTGTAHFLFETPRTSGTLDIQGEGFEFEGVFNIESEP